MSGKSPPIPPPPTVGEGLLDKVVTDEKATESETEKIFKQINSDKEEIKSDFISVRQGWKKIMRLAAERDENKLVNGVPRFFTWECQSTLDEVEKSYGFLITLIINLEDAGIRAGHKAVEKSSLETPILSQTPQLQTQSNLQPVVNVNVQQPQGRESLPTRVRSAASRILSREQKLALSPLRTMSYDLEIKSVLDNYMQFQPNWNRFIAWYQPKLELKTIFVDVDPVVYWYHMSMANEFLHKLRFQMVGGAFASAKKLSGILDEQRVELAKYIMQLSIERQKETKRRNVF